MDRTSDGSHSIDSKSSCATSAKWLVRPLFPHLSNMQVSTWPLGVLPMLWAHNPGNLSGSKENLKMKQCGKMSLLPMHMCIFNNAFLYLITRKWSPVSLTGKVKKTGREKEVLPFEWHNGIPREKKPSLIAEKNQQIFHLEVAFEYGFEGHIGLW